MQKRVRSLKVLGILTVGGSLFLGGGCLNSLLKNVWAGFGIGLGQIPAQTIYDTYLGGIIGGITGGDNTNDNA